MQDVQIVQMLLLVVVLVSLVCPMTCRRRAMVVMVPRARGTEPVRMSPSGGCYGKFADGCPVREKDTGNSSIYGPADTAHDWTRNAADRGCLNTECEMVTP